MIQALALAASLQTSEPATAAPNGFWRTPQDGGSIVRIGDCGEALCGWIVTSPRLRANPDQRDVLNGDPVLRARLVRDLMIFKADKVGANLWGHGWLYDPTVGFTYKGLIELKDPQTLRLTGCVAAILCRSQTWRRAD